MAEPELRIQPESERSTRVDLMLGERSISRLWINHFTLHIGAAKVRMEGIGGVGTDEEFRNRGYSRWVMEGTVEHMRKGDAALSMLYGIPNFYPKFGYTTAGPDHYMRLRGVEGTPDMPSGWRARPFVAADLPAMQAVYERNTARAVGAAVRAADGHPWKELLNPRRSAEEQCRVVLDPGGQVRGYVWRTNWHWYVEVILAKRYPEAFVVGEVMAEGPTSADAVLATCRAWAVEERARGSGTVSELIFSQPPEGPVATAARYQWADFILRYDSCGNSMVRALDTGRLLRALAPELSERLAAAGGDLRGRMRLSTEVGSAVVRLGPEGVTVSDADPVPGGPSRDTLTRDLKQGDLDVEISLPQSALARLSLGAFRPEDLLSRLETPPEGAARDLLIALFPERHPHMGLPDRF